MTGQPPRPAFHDYAAEAERAGLGKTHALPSQHDHLGRRYPCGLYVYREQYDSRYAPLQVTTRPGDHVTCPGCLAAMGNE